MARLRIIGILGGPLDGRRLAWDTDVDLMTWTDGSRIYYHALDEVWTGKRMKKVLRHVQTVPMPTRKTQGEE
jgi:hypothetical protein